METDLDRGDRLCVFNGINGETGGYFYRPLSAREIFQGFQAAPKDREKALIPGINPKDLSEAGWGVVFHASEDPAVVEALRPLLDHRKEQATRRHERLYQEFSGANGYSGESKEEFLAKHGATMGPVNPNRMPYYLLLVGEPDRIPYSFQHQLDVQYGVGRISFDTPEEYARYAKSVVDAESGQVKRDRRVSLFGARNPDDVAMTLSADLMVKPLVERLGTPEDWQESPPWEVRSAVAEDATKARLSQLLGGAETPALFFSASHGMGFPSGSRLQQAHQGSLLCQDWPGPVAWNKPVPPEFYFSGDDLASDARVHGLIAFFFACNGVGTPALDEFAQNGTPPRVLAPKPFATRLPQRLLAHPGGGALAVIGHVERAWAYSFLGKGDEKQTEAFEYALRLLMEGFPVGFAMEYFNQRYAELSTELTLALQRVNYGQPMDQDELAALWTANNDARNYAVVGDPAVRLAV
ncbi:MAG: C25 family cysteine peptidase [Thermoanaerobaculia bacterium]